MLATLAASSRTAIQELCPKRTEEITRAVAVTGLQGKTGLQERTGLQEKSDPILGTGLEMAGESVKTGETLAPKKEDLMGVGQMAGVRGGLKVGVAEDLEVVVLGLGLVLVLVAQLTAVKVQEQAEATPGKEEVNVTLSKCQLISY